MKKYVVLVTIIIVIAAVGLTIRASAPPIAVSTQADGNMASSHPPAGSSPAITTAPAAEDASVDVDRFARVDALVKQGFIPPEYRELWLDPDYERIANERFNVIPKASSPDKGPCNLTTVDSGVICWSDFGHHPYLAYSLSDLKQMADTDPAAAEALALRLPQENRDQRLHFALKASQLSGKSGPIMRFVYTLAPDRNSPNYADQLLDRYAIALAGEAMGYPYRLSRELEIQIMRDLGLGPEELDEAMNKRRVSLAETWGEG